MGEVIIFFQIRHSQSLPFTAHSSLHEREGNLWGYWNVLKSTLTLC